MSINRFSKVFIPSEYTPPFDLNTYGAIGQQKDQEFDQHLQLLQSGLDQIVSQTDLVRPQDREAFNSKMTSIVNQINQHGNEDLGDSSVLSNVQGMGKQVYGDPTIINAIGATQQYRKTDAQVEDDRKKGKMADMNKYVYDKQVNSWMNDPQVGASFNASYTPYYDYKKKQMDMLAHVKATGEITTRDINGGLQTQIIKTKGLSEDRLMQIVNDNMATDPQMQKQMQIETEYLVDHMKPEDVAKGYIDYSSDMAKGYQNQIYTLQGLKSDAMQKGDKPQADHYDEEINKATSEMNRYAGYVTQPEGTAAMIKQDPYYYYGSVYGHNFAKGAAGVFAQHDVTMTYQTNLDRVMAEKFKYAMLLAQAKGKTGKSVFTGDMINAPANESNNARREQQQIDLQLQTQQAIASDKNGLRNMMSETDPVSGSRYKGPSGEGNWNSDYNKWQELYKDGEGDTLPDAVRSHFERLGAYNNSYNLSTQERDNINKELQKNKAFINANNKINEKVSKMPAVTTVKGANGIPVMNMNRDEAVQMTNGILNEDFETKQASFTDGRGNSHNFDYQLPKGNSPAVQRVRAQIEKNVQNAINRAPNVKWSEAILDLPFGLPSPDIDNWLVQQGVKQDKYLTRGGANLLSFVTGGPGLMAYNNATFNEHILGSYLDNVFHSGTANHDVIDRQLTDIGLYDAVRSVGKVASTIKNNYYDMGGFATMTTLRIIDQGKDAQDIMRPLVQTALGKYNSPDAVKNVINLTRNTTTGSLQFTYTTDKDEKAQKTVDVPPELEGTISRYYPVNPTQDIENSLKRMESFNATLHPDGAHEFSSTTGDVNKAYQVPGTDKKVRFFYHPKENQPYSYMYYLGNGSWTGQIPVASLDQAISTIQEQAHKVSEDRKNKVPATNAQ
jgi:hypothetical protein